MAHYTGDVDYIEHALGTMKGREQVRDWIYRTMTTFPGSHMTAFPSLWAIPNAVAFGPSGPSGAAHPFGPLQAAVAA